MGENKLFNKKYWRFVEQKCKGYTIGRQIQIFMRYFNKIIKFIDFNNKNIKVLDVGCGYGYFLKVCEEKTIWQLYGVDISNYAIKKAKDILKRTKLLNIDVNKRFPFDNKYFDLITMFDVIEHLKSPYYTLKECYRTLKTNGLIVITTPNLNAIEKLWKKEKWHGFDDPTHLYLFTPESLRLLVKRLEFKIEVLETPYHSLPNILSNILGKVIKRGGTILLIGRKL